MIARAGARATRRGAGTDRIFLDANVLFSAAYRAGGAVELLWASNLNITLISSGYAIEEARRNLDDVQARERLERLIAGLEIVSDVATGSVAIPAGLPEKDRPILLAAIAAGATHLLTGDRAHFGAYFGRRIGGVLIERPGNYLASLR